MRDLTEWLRLNMRVCLAATLIIEAAMGLVPQMATCNIPSVIGGMDHRMVLASSALSALYFVLSIWLMLGIRTSLTALASAVLLIVPAILIAPNGDPALAVKITLITVFSVPLVLYGGGRYAVLDTREPWMLDEDDDTPEGEASATA
jgi:type IV secretory pathway TrbD component